MVVLPSCVHKEHGTGACGITRQIHQAGLRIGNLDRTLGEQTLHINGSSPVYHCGAARGGEDCIGAYIPRYRLQLLLQAVRDGVVLISPEHRIKFTRIVGALYEKRRRFP